VFGPYISGVLEMLYLEVSPLYSISHHICGVGGVRRPVDLWSDRVDTWSKHLISDWSVLASLVHFGPLWVGSAQK